MMTTLQHIAKFGLAAAVAVTCASCGDSGPALYPVQGKVLVDGQPADNALLMFHPVNKIAGLENPLVARAGADGSFQLTTIETNDGAPPGEYVVTVQWSAPPATPFDGSGPDKLRGRYRDSKTSELRAKVEAKPTQLETYQLSPGSASPASRDAGL